MYLNVRKLVLAGSVMVHFLFYFILLWRKFEKLSSVIIISMPSVYLLIDRTRQSLLQLQRDSQYGTLAWILILTEDSQLRELHSCQGIRARYHCHFNNILSLDIVIYWAFIDFFLWVTSIDILNQYNNSLFRNIPCILEFLSLFCNMKFIRIQFKEN